MNDHPDPHRHEQALAAVERRLELRLERRSGAEPPPNLRHRVLMAVDDVLAERRPVPHDARAGMAPGWAWTAAAVGLAGAVALFVAAAPTRRVEPLTLAGRMRVAGVADEGLFAATTVALSPAAGGPSVAHADLLPGIRTADHLIDRRRLLEENL